MSTDPWMHRSSNMSCKTCMWFVIKEKEATKESTKQVREKVNTLGRCRRHCPSMNGYPTVFITDWCGDHKLDENKLV